MSRAVRFHQTGDPEVLKIENVEVPTPGEGEVRIAVKASRPESRRIDVPLAANIWKTQNFPPASATKPPARSTRRPRRQQDLKPGDAVSTIPAFSQNQYGVYGDLVLAPAVAVAKHPPNLSWTEAAAIWMQYITAYGALIDIAKLTTGDRSSFPPLPAASASPPFKSPTWLAPDPSP